MTETGMLSEEVSAEKPSDVIQTLSLEAAKLSARLEAKEAELGRLHFENEQLHAAVNVERRAFKMLIIKFEAVQRELWIEQQGKLVVPLAPGHLGEAR